MKSQMQAVGIESNRLVVLLPHLMTALPDTCYLVTY